MPTPDYFAQHAPFPDDIPVAQLEKLSLKKILDSDEAEAHALFQASCDNGFFLLDFTGCQDCELIMTEVRQCFDVHREFFALDDTAKRQFPDTSEPGKSTIGYKPPGNIKDDKGRVDRAEIMTHGIQEILLSDSIDMVGPFQSHSRLLQCTATHLHSIAVSILSALEKPLQLPKGTFSALSNPSGPTMSQLRFLHMAPDQKSQSSPTKSDPSLAGHTDNGSLTILFNVIGGLQIIPPGCDPDDEGSWRWVRPQPGCAVVNLGDSMVKWSGQLFRSNIHRVVDPPGLQAADHRYSGGYFLKPPNDALMRPLMESPLIKALIERDGEDTDVMTYFDWNSRRNATLKTGMYKLQSQGGRPLPNLVTSWENMPHTKYAESAITA